MTITATTNRWSYTGDDPGDTGTRSGTRSSARSGTRSGTRIDWLPRY